MTRRWIITGTSSGFGHEIARQALDRGDVVVGTVRRDDAAADLREAFPDTFSTLPLDVSDTAAIAPAIDEAVARLGGVDVLVSNAGYGLFGAAEELSDEQIDHQIATNLRGAIQVVRAAVPHLRAGGGGRIVQLSSVAGLTGYAGASLYHATKWGIEGFCEALAGEVAAFGIGVTLVEPGSARTSFAHGGRRWGDRLPAYDVTPVAAVRTMLDSADFRAPGDPVAMVRAMIAAVDAETAPRRIVLGSDAYTGIVAALEARLDEVRPQADSAAASDS